MCFLTSTSIIPLINWTLLFYKVSGRTKDLEKETVKWQQRWEDSNAALHRMVQNYQKVQEELNKSQDSLEKMKSLCRTLHSDNRKLLTELKGHKGQSDSEMAPLSDAVAETLASITASTETQCESSIATSASDEKSAPVEKTAEIVSNENLTADELKLLNEVVTNKPMEEDKKSSPAESAASVNLSDNPPEANGDGTQLGSSSSTPTSGTVVKDDATKEDGGNSKNKKNKKKNKKK